MLIYAPNLCLFLCSICFALLPHFYRDIRQCSKVAFTTNTSNFFCEISCGDMHWAPCTFRWQQFLQTFNFFPGSSFIFLIFRRHFYCILFHYHLFPLYPLPPSPTPTSTLITTLLSVSMSSFFFFALSLHPEPPTQSCQPTLYL